MKQAFLRENEKSGVQASAAGSASSMAKLKTHAAQEGKFGSVSVATTTEAEEEELESRELGANYDVNARVIEMMLQRSSGHNTKRARDQDEGAAKRKRGTLL